MPNRRWLLAVVTLAGWMAAPATISLAQTRAPADWIALAAGGFAVPQGATAAGLLVEMNPLLASADPRLRDEVAYSAAQRWIVRDALVAPDDLRRLLELWSSNLDDGLGSTGDDRVFKRSFSALCLSLIAAREVTAPFLRPEEGRRFLDRMLDYFGRERDLRGFEPDRGWIHTPAHTADALKFLARGAHFAPADLGRLLAALRAKIEASESVFVWGENDRMAWALHAAVRRPDAETAAFEAWTARWIDDHAALWAGGPQVDPRRFARVENGKQLLRSLAAILSMERTPTGSGETARMAAVTALARMR
jgi:hypothetical protein